MNLPKTRDALKFLHESNLIEDVSDADSLMQAYYAWEYLTKPGQKFRGNTRELPLSAIKTAHKILMHNHLPPNEKGYFRSVGVTVGGKPCPAPELVRPLMEDFVKRVELTSKHSKTGIEEAIKNDHVAFEKIHAFVDGNGRTGRLIMNWQRVQAGLPILIIEADKRQEYYGWFEEEASTITGATPYEAV